MNFHDVMTRAGFKLTPPTASLDFLLFASDRDFAAYESRAHRGRTRWTGGYYSGRDNRVVMYHADDGSHVRRTLHEAAHLLAFNTGVQKRGVGYPLWFAEGLATNFESDATDRPFGPTTPNPGRLRTLRAMDDAHRLVPLREFITHGASDVADGAERSEQYAQAWGLFRFLFNERPRGLVAYVEAMNARPRGRQIEESHRVAFAAAFGEPDTLEAAFRQYVRSL